MEIRRLNYFVRIAEDRSLTKAAAILRVAQSALSRQMRLLEEELGVTLFDRTARGMRLTAEGEQLRLSVAGPLREVELAIQNIRAGPSAVEANLAIGMPPGLADVLARRLAMDLHTQFPNIRFSLVEGPTGALIDWLGRGMIDFAVLEESARTDALSEQALIALPFALAGPLDSPLAPGRVVPVREALRLPLILQSHHMGIRAAIDEAARRVNAKLDIRFAADSARLAKDLVEQGVGHCLLPLAYIQREVADGLLQAWSLDDPALTLDIVLCSRRGSQISGRQFGAVEACIAGMARSALAAHPA